MMSTPCIAGEHPHLNLTQSYALHQVCTGIVLIPGRPEPEACSCPHHGMAQGPRRRRISLRAKTRLVVAVAILLAVAWMYLR